MSVFVTIPADRWTSIFGKPQARCQEPPKANPTPKPESQRPRRTRRPRKPSVPKAPGSEPGIYYDVPFGDYIGWPHVNNTLLSHAARSMAHFRYAQLNRSDESTAAQTFGRIIHFGALEPSVIDSPYVIMPDFA